MPSRPTVLIVEDDPVFRRVLSYMVQRGGWSVLSASDGEQGYNALVSEKVDFVVSDYQMPRCSGVEMLRRIALRADFCRPPAILCTAKGLEIDSSSLIAELDLTAIMHKPFSPRKLAELLGDTIGQGAPETSSVNSGRHAPNANSLVQQGSQLVRSADWARRDG